ncbi:putative rRNA maturation factor [Geomicrobium halophilum]|uniref:Endoribonuclease YbeY n=1 Tax=Geomicrobium halophilum TaxID=549000 RepID=A0A841PXS9_9BACL|nr:rRNA maturation RNase YbeY [Geomicrobium halophilum]MBB6448835.1 putative rRNA maturation factor [Geomicrobium halophilum]
MTIDVHDETGEMTEKHVTLVTIVLQSAQDRLHLHKDTECSLLFVDQATIQALNRDYRGKDKVTDVLSFALNDEDGFEIAQDEHILGDIVLCVERAREQAREYGHSFERELCFLAIHGLLHLIGYDHGTAEEEQEMFTLQEDLLKAYGLERKP